MVRIAPIRLVFNPKTLWFDAGDLELKTGDDVVVTTARGTEFGQVVSSVFEISQEETKTLHSPLKPVKRVATDDDREKSDGLVERSREALPTFKQLAAEAVPDMNPVAVEFLFDGDKAVFYFESEDRVDFRDLVRKLASEFHVRVDMKQIGVRDEARMIGGLGHCGQELCCRRIGGDFNPVSIRMAKEQDLSLNPQKISGTCGRLMCCLRYEYEAYKDFHTRAPKKNAKIQTPEGEGKVVDLDVPREIVSIQVGDGKPVKVPLADMDEPEEGARPTSVGEEAWRIAKEPPTLFGAQISSLFSVELSGEDKLAEPGSIRHVHGEEDKSTSGRSRRKRTKASGSDASEPAAAASHKTRRRRSTTVSSDGSTTSSRETPGTAAKPQPKAPAKQAASKSADESAQQKSSSRRRRSRRGGAAKAAEQKSASAAKTQTAPQQSQGSKVGRNSSALRARRAAAAAATDKQAAPAGEAKGQQASADAPSKRRPRRRRSHRAGNQGAAGEGTTGAGE